MSDSEKESGRKRESKLFDPHSSKTFQLSRYRLERFMECSLCFWLELRRGVKRPEPHPYTLNSAVDRLIKNEFDIYRRERLPHPLMQRFGINGIPFSHPRFEDWRLTTPGKGMRFLFPGTNLDIMGAPDDIWLISESSLAVVDTKATSAKEIHPIEDDWWKSYRRQLDIYIWLLDRQETGYRVSRTGYFLLLNGIAESEHFDLALKFTPTIIAYQADDSWVEEKIRAAYACLLQEDVPTASSNCELCNYRRKTAELRL